MAEKIIKMKLNYKGKLLDIAKKGSGRGDIQKKWFIGSNKHIFWQILDPKFPDKHLFLEEKGNQYFLNVVPGSELNCEKNGKSVDKEYLKSNNLLSGSQLKLTPELSGTVALNKDWVISFEFVEPFKRVLTAEERQIISQYSRLAELSPLDRRNKNIMIFATIFTLVFLFVYDNFLKKETVIDDTIEAKYDTIIAQRMEVEKVESRTKRASASSEEAPVATDAEATGTATGPATGKPSLGAKLAAGGASGIGGGEGGESTTGSLKVLTTSRTITAVGGGGGGGGRGPGAGSSGAGGGRAGATLGGSSGPMSRPSGREYIGDLSTGSVGRGVATTNLQSGQALERFRGDAGSIKPGVPIISGSAEATMKRVQGSGGKVVKEGDIPAGDTATKTSYEAAIQNLRAIRQRVQSEFNRFSSTKAMFGSIEFTIYVEANGNVDVVAKVINGEFEQEFVDAAINAIKRTKFNTSVAMVIPFTQQFRRN